MLNFRKSKKDEFSDDFEGDEALLQKEAEGANSGVKNEVFTAREPSLNLIPESVLNHYGILKIRNRFAAGAAVIGLLFGGYYVANIFVQGGLESQIQEFDENSSATMAIAATLSGYRTFHDSVDEARKSMSNYVSTHIDTGRIYDSIMNVSQAVGTSLDNISISIVTPGELEAETGVQCESPDPFGAYNNAGCVTFSGTATDRSQIARFVESLDSQPGFRNTYVGSSTINSGEGGSSAVLQGSVSFTPEFFTDRYSDLSVDMEVIGNEEGFSDDSNPAVEENTEGNSEDNG